VLAAACLHAGAWSSPLPLQVHVCTAACLGWVLCACYGVAAVAGCRRSGGMFTPLQADAGLPPHLLMLSQAQHAACSSSCM
jgi:hypothetical protein